MDVDAIVIGGGHAGIEAALALARLDHSTLFITQNLDAIGKLSCNPAVGGLAKGNLVREIDALGGQMGRLIDETMIQFRILNRSRGPAVRAPRAQADKPAYQRRAKQVLEEQSGLWLFQDTVVDFILDSGGHRVEGVVTERGRRFSAQAVVLTTGTFLNGRIFIGDHSAEAGRLGEPPSHGVDRPLREAGFRVGRLKTGTPARVAASSINFDEMEVQHGDEMILPFSFSNDEIDRPQTPCYITYTTEETHRIIRENMEASPLYSGKIVGVGPRYCPSIEDKVVKFPDRTRHQIFVEPEGLGTEEMYLNGISSSLPEAVQERFIRTLAGLRDVHIARPGYAVEYDYIDSTQLYPSLESKPLARLFVAGQTNGSSGYEEAAAQGLMAGINASRSIRGEPPFVLSRADAYIGVLVDDLVTVGTREPYRMFTSRAEHRLSLRHDSADRRLTRRAYELGLQSREAFERFEAKERSIDEIKELLRKRHVDDELVTAIEAARVGATDRVGAAGAREGGGPDGVGSDIREGGGLDGGGAGAREGRGLDRVGSDIREGGGRDGANGAAPQGAGAREGGGLDGANGAAPQGGGAREPMRHKGKTLYQVLKDPTVTIEHLAEAVPELGQYGGRSRLAQVELDVKYEGYVARQERQVDRFRRLEGLPIPSEFDYDSVEGLSNEAREKLKAIRPFSVGQASRVSGVRNSDITVLLVSLGRKERAS
ncbi:MAG: tRNA uridine-5-carboxymethylaminomethyl(34) synthesis enzyme MnmG [Spirochaetia bacterium]